MIEEIHKNIEFIPVPIQEQAKEMEKQQIIDAHVTGLIDPLIMKNLNNISSGMFFVMRDNIKPIYEDSQNMSGGYWSIRLMKRDSYDYFKKIVYYILMENLMKKDEHNSKINGLSISPKINNCIFKIWNSDYTGLKTSDLRKDIDGLSTHFENTFYLQHKE